MWVRGDGKAGKPETSRWEKEPGGKESLKQKKLMGPGEGPNYQMVASKRQEDEI